MSIIPSYIKLYNSGELHDRIKKLEAILTDCRLCPRNCRKNRLKGEFGICKAGAELMVSSVFSHFGEESPLVGYGGSGTIFLTHCNLRCIFCQNYDISHSGEGKEVTADEFSGYMIYLQKLGCHNINFVTPTHYAPQIIASLPKAVEMGLELPLVWNCGGYESAEVIKLLDGIVDIYMPDFKYGSSAPAKKYSKAPDYPDIVKKVLKEMHRQVGVLKMDNRGIAYKGLLIRHLIMPDGLAGTKEAVEFIAKKLSPDSYVNIMDQYRPCYKAFDYHEIARRITPEEYEEAIRLAREVGLHRGF
ncbi:MAG: radical SAM protein [Nitrospinae bacterium]|nr:radical SAM protein [Nitrospinota bacterium]